MAPPLSLQVLDAHDAPLARDATLAMGHRAPVDPSSLLHRQLLDGPFWRHIPAYQNVTEAQFRDHAWQAKHSITRVSELAAALQSLVSPEFIADVEQGMKRAPMSVRVTPYLLSLIDWSEPYRDPLRIQFFPLASRLLPDHPELRLDSLHEQDDAPISGLVHRYSDKVLYLPVGTCPVYCRFCTRSYAIGLDTEEVEKVRLRRTEERWQQVVAYIAAREEIEDVLVSGGDAYQLRAEQLGEIGRALLALPNVRRMRFATRGLAAMPQKILSDAAWTDALTRVVELGRRLHKEVVVHTHFNHASEITALTRLAFDALMERGVTVRTQSVLQRGVNDSPEAMTLLVRRLGYVNAHPYYVYMHDLVEGVEDLRTSLDVALRIEKHVRGATAGFNTPVFVVDAPGGGGKRDAHSFEHYDRETGISVYAAPAVKPGKAFLYFDPLHALGDDARRRWGVAREREAMVHDALAKAGASGR